MSTLAPDSPRPLLLRWVLLAAWLPMALVVGLITGIELAGYGAAASGAARAGSPGWAQWLLMSGNGVLLGWALFCGEAGARAGGSAGPLSGPGFGPGLAAVMILTCWIVVGVEARDSAELAGLTLLLFGPTLLVGYSLVGSGLSGLKRLRHVALVLGGVASVNLLCQLGYASGGFDDARPLTLGSIFLGVCLAMRLAIWWLTDEGYVSMPRV